MIDHINIAVSDLDHSKAFYAKALAPLGYQLLMERPGTAAGAAPTAGFGIPPKPDFWISAGTVNTLPVHIALAAADRAQVDAFHAAALAAGGRDNGAPGLRPQYHASYYGAFVRDPDGHNIEAVCHAPA